MATKTQLPQKFSIGGLLGNALNDVGSVVSGVASIPGKVISDVQNPQQAGNDVKNIVSSVASEYNDLLGDPYNTKTNSFQAPNIQEAGSHAYQHPVNTLLDVLPFVKPLQAVAGLGKAGEVADAAGAVGDTGNALQKAGNSLKNDITRIKLDPSVNGAGQEAAVQNTINKVVPGNTAAQKYANLAPTMQDLGNQIGDILSTSPKDIPVSEIRSTLTKKLQPLVLQGTLPETEAAKEVEGYISRMYGAANPVQELAGAQNTVGPAIASQKLADVLDAGTTARGDASLNSQFVRMGGVKAGIEGPPGYLKEILNPGSKADAQFAGEGLNTPTPYTATEPAKLPDTIDSPTAFKMKLLGNSAAKGLFDKGTLTNTQKVTMALRNGMDEVITKAHPEIKQLTTQQSHLFDAADSLSAARSANHSTQILGTDIPSGLAAAGKGVLANILSKAGDATSTVGNMKGVLAPVLAGTTEGNLQNEGNNGEPNNESNHGQSISQGNKDVNRYSVTSDPVKSGALMPTDAYNSQLNDVTTRLANATATGDTVTAQKLAGQEQVLKNTYDSQKTLRDAWNDPVNHTGTQNVLTVGNYAYQAVKSADPSFLNALNKGYDYMATASNGKFSQMASYLTYLQHTTGIDFTQFKTKDSLAGAIDAAMNITKNQWETTVSQYTAKPQTLASPLQKVLSPAASSVPTNGRPQGSFPAGGFGGTGDALTGHPGLDSIIQAGM